MRALTFGGFSVIANSCLTIACTGENPNDDGGDSVEP
jgi:hypothetical protein